MRKCRCGGKYVCITSDHEKDILKRAIHRCEQCGRKFVQPLRRAVKK